jgi:hypothetical protein
MCRASTLSSDLKTRSSRCMIWRSGRILLLSYYRKHGSTFTWGLVRSSETVYKLTSRSSSFPLYHYHSPCSKYQMNATTSLCDRKMRLCLSKSPDRSLHVLLLLLKNTFTYSCMFGASHQYLNTTQSSLLLTTTPTVLVKNKPKRAISYAMCGTPQ